MNGDGSFEIIEKMKGSRLVGLEYERLYPLAPEALQRLTAREGNTRF